MSRRSVSVNGHVSIHGRRSVSATLAGCITLLTGCVSVGPNYHRPEAPASATFKEAEGWKVAQPREAEPRGNWWDIYKDPDLDVLMRQVQVSNQNVLLAEARYEQAVALVGQARAGYFPTLGALVSTTRSQNAFTSQSSGFGSTGTGTGTGGVGSGGGAPGGGTGSGGTGAGGVGTGTGVGSGTGAGGTTTTSTAATTSGRTATLDRASLSASWELDVWGRIRRTVESNRASAQATAGDLASALLSAQATLAQSYFQLRVIDLDLGLLERSIDAYQKALEVTENRYQAGVAQRSDVTQAQSQLETARAQWLDLGITRATLEHAIAVLVGKPPSALAIHRTDQVPVLPDIPLSLPSELLERRPDVAAAERRVAAANAQIGVAKAAYFPTLSISASGGYENTGWGKLFELPNRFWSVGPELAETLFDGGLRKWQVREARAVYDQNVASYRQTVLTAFQDVEDNLATLRILQKEVVAERAAADAAAQTLQIMENLYKAGTVDYLNVVSAQTTSLTAERAYRDMVSRALVASAGLLKALGGSWSTAGLPK
jgi:NodT family efflux transporter outer membrane factor (OMF) lipoprotein